MLKSDDLLHFQVKIIFLYNLEEIYFQPPHNKIKKKNNTKIKTMQKKNNMTSES